MDKLQQWWNRWFSKPRNTDDVLARAARWIISDDTGTSSKTLWAVMMGVPKEHIACLSFPWDLADFGRCQRLLQLIPEWRARLHEMRTVSPQWNRLVDAWPIIERQILISPETARLLLNNAVRDK